MPEAVMHFGVNSRQISRCEAFNSPQITQIQQIYADFLDKSKLFQWKSAEITMNQQESQDRHRGIFEFSLCSSGRLCETLCSC